MSEEATTTAATAEVAPETAPATTPAAPAAAPTSVPQVPAQNFVPQSRFDELARERKEERRAREAVESRLQATLASLAALQSQFAGQQAQEPQQQQVAQVGERTLTLSEARELASIEAQRLQFDQQCNVVAAQGKQKYQDFDDAIGALRRVSPFDVHAGAQVVPNWVIEAAFEASDEPHELLYALGKDPKEAERIVGLPPLKAATAIAKYAAMQKKSGKVLSGAPAPVGAEVGAGKGEAIGTVDLYQGSKVSLSDWMAQREKTRKTRR